MQWLRRLFGLLPAPTVIHQPDIAFVVEQNGGPEEDLKAQWRPILSTSAGVRRAYLVVVSYDQMKSFNVACCIAADDRTNLSLVRALQRPFDEQFSNQCQLDILFLTFEQESKVRAVAKPFYSTDN